MNNLRAQLGAIADQFVSAVLAALTSASLSELSDAPARRLSKNGAPSSHGRGRRPKIRSAHATASATQVGGGRRKRSSPAEVQRQKDVALTAAKALKSGFSKGDIMTKSASSVDLGRALALLVAEGTLKKKGDRRRTRYWLA